MFFNNTKYLIDFWAETLPGNTMDLYPEDECKSVERSLEQLATSLQQQSTGIYVINIYEHNFCTKVRLHCVPGIVTFSNRRMQMHFQANMTSLGLFSELSTCTKPKKRKKSGLNSLFMNASIPGTHGRSKLADKLLLKYWWNWTQAAIASVYFQESPTQKMIRKLQKYLSGVNAAGIELNQVPIWL
jgi:hypothetical protein